MKNGFFKLATLTVLLGSSLAQAQSTVNSVIPLQKPGLSLSITGLYLQPSASNLGYSIFTTPLPLPAPNWKQKVVNPGYTGAVDVGLQYNLFSNSDNVKLDWFYLSSKDSASATSVPNTSVGPAYYYGPAEQFLLNTSASSTAKFNVNGGSMVMAHLFNVTNHVQIEPFVGLNVTYLKEDITNNYLGTDPVFGAYRHTVYGKSELIGAGPRLGFDARYYVTNQFAIVAGLAGDFLAGNIKYQTNFNSVTAYTGDSIHNSTPVDTSMANENLTRAVPVLGTKLGLEYKVPMNAASSELSLQAGYDYSVYFNAIHQVLPSTLVPGAWESGTVAIINQVQQQSNFNLQGLYFKAAYKF
jgi:hypothetical protein